jgi:ketosteroid isomerase-like protein
MNSKPSLTEIVQEMYGSFGRGDLPAILARLHPEVKWGVNAEPADPGVGSTPLFRPFSGPTGVSDFFALLERELEFHAFEPVGFTANHAEVVARLFIDTTVRATRRRVRVESLHHFTFDSAGKLVRFREFTDTLAIAAAWGAVPGGA